jgi:hypothetical protein
MVDVSAMTKIYKIELGTFWVNMLKNGVDFKAGHIFVAAIF